jgi:hypothetical protein
MKKIILSGIVVILVLGAAAGTYWWISRPQVITFSDDTTLTLLGADYGKKHTVPGGKLPPAKPRTATQGGATVRQPANRTTSTFNTVADTLVVWLRAKYDQSSDTPNQNRNFQFYIYDKAGTACAQANGYVQQGTEVFNVQFPAFPRRQGKLYLRVQESGNGGQEMADEKFVINNPAAAKSYPKWTPEPLPVTKEDDGLSVTLTKLVSGADSFSRDQDNPDDAMNKGVQVAYRIARGGKPVTNWQPVSVETTDATGNRTAINYGPNGGNQAQWNGDEARLTLQNGLWPDEPAWKLRMEFTQNSDFSSDEQWTAQNIPVVLGSQQGFNGLIGRGNPVGRGAAPGAANPPTAPTPFAETDLNGHHIKIFPAVQFTNTPQNLPPNYVQPQQAGLMIQIQPAVVNFVGRPMNGVNGTPTTDDGLRLALAKVTDGQGGEITSYNSGSSPTGTGGADSSSTFRYRLRDTDGVTNINVTIALHKNRFFEFTVKPEMEATAK